MQGSWPGSCAVSFPIIPMITLITQTRQPYDYNTKTHNQPHTTATTASPTDQCNPSSFTFFKQRRCEPVTLPCPGLNGKISESEYMIPQDELEEALLD